MTPMQSSRERRKALIRTVAALTGDLAVGVAFTSACAWVISAAALGAFMTFLAWLIAALLWLVVSQHLVHPSVQFLLSDQKLDAVVDTARGLSDVFVVMGTAAGHELWQAARRSVFGVQRRFARA